jgi:hypothetical protein
VPKGSVVLCANRHISYLRTDIVMAVPHYVPFNNDSETWTDFVSRVRKQFPQKKIYMLADDGDLMHRAYHQSIKDFVPSHPGSKIFQF